jgi:uncharacterized membrane protein YhaH (DUF805 family)
MEWMVLPYRRYFDFEGRSTRREYWLFQLFFFLVLFGPATLAAAMGLISETGSDRAGSTIFEVLFGLLLIVFFLGSLIPLWAVTVRRLHDQDRSGAFALLQIIPFGDLILLVMMFRSGTPGPNRYGPDPRDISSASVFA